MSVVACTSWDGRIVARIIRLRQLPDVTTFLTDAGSPQQVGHVVYPAGSEVPRHFHRPVERQLVGTAEVIIVQRGRCIIDLYNDKRQLLSSHHLEAGDIAILGECGHGFRMIEDTVLLEVKQGPYLGPDEKQRF